MAMNLGDLLQMIRQDYMDTLDAAAEEAGHTVVREPALQPEAELGKEVWADLKLGSRLIKVPTEGVFQFDERIIFGWGDELPGQPAPLQVVVNPFAWDAASFTLTPAANRVIDTEPLLQWLDQWSAEPDAESKAQQVWKEVAHSLKKGAGENTYVADLGTAPLEAWQDLLEAALAAGAKQIVFGGM
jgi:hypothetical protein